MDSIVTKQLIKAIGKMFSFLKKKSEKKYPTYSILTAMGMPPKGNDFDTLYNATLYEFEHKYAKHTLLIDLFKEKDAKSAFTHDWLYSSQNKLLEDLETNLNVKEKYLDIKDAKIDLVTEINHFNEIFSVKFRHSQTPHENEMLRRLTAIEGKLPQVSADSFDISEHLQEISKLRDQNQHEAVRVLLVRYKEQKWTTLTDEVKYKLTVHLGVTFYELGEKEEGARYFIELLQFNIKPAETYSLVALGYALLGNASEALIYADKALFLNDKSENAYLAKLFVKGEDITAKELYELIPKDMQEVPIIALNIATTLDKLGISEEAYTIFSRLEKQHQEMDSFRADVLLQLAVNRIHSLSKKEDYLYDQLGQKGEAKLNLALEYLDTVWDFFKHTALNKSRSYILANRGVVHKALGNQDFAERDLLASIELKKTFFAYSNLLEVYNNKREKFRHKLAELKCLPLKGNEAQQVLLYDAIEGILDKNTDAVLPDLLKELPNIIHADISNKFYNMVVDIHLQKLQFSEARYYSSQLIDRNNEDAFSYVLAWRVEVAEENEFGGLQYIEKALSLAKESTANTTLWELSMILLGLDKFREASEVLHLAADTDILSKFTQNLIIAEFKAGNHREAFLLAEQLSKKYINNPLLTEIIANVYEINGQYQEAEKSIKDFLKVHPNDVFFRVKLAMNLYKKSDYKAGVDELDKIVDYNSIPLDYQFMIADAYIKGGNPEKGLEIGYKIRFENFSNENVHNRYIQIQTQVRGLDKSHYFPEVIGVNCYVVLRDDHGKLQEYIIVDKPSYPMEIGSNEEFVLQLLGKRVGETISRGKQVLTITQIKWKYTYALHASMDMIQTRYNNEGPIKVFQIDNANDPLQVIKSFIDKTSEGQIRKKEIDDMYNSRKATIGISARLSGMSIMKYWGQLVSDPASGVFTNGTSEELRDGVRKLSDGSPVVIDVIALLTLHYTDNLSLLELLPNHKYITQSTIDVISEELTELEERSNMPDVMINEIDGKLYRTIVSVEEKSIIIDRVKGLLNAARSVAEVVFSPLPDDFAEKSEKDLILGKCFNESMLVAADKSGVLLSDDGVLREVSRGEYATTGLPIIGLVNYLLSEKIIQTEDADRVYAGLINHNYLFVPMRPELLLRICKACEYMISPSFIRACDCLNPLMMTNEMAAKFTAVFFRLLYLNVLASPVRDLVVQFTLSKLYGGRDYPKIKVMITAFVNEQFKLLPNQKDELIRVISLM